MEIPKIYAQVEMQRLSSLEAIERNFVDMLKMNEDKYKQHIEMQNLRIKKLEKRLSDLQEKAWKYDDLCK